MCANIVPYEFKMSKVMNLKLCIVVYIQNTVLYIVYVQNISKILCLKILVPESLSDCAIRTA